MKPPILVRFPKSHRAFNAVARKLGYEPHQWRSFKSECLFAYLPEPDAALLVNHGLAMIPANYDRAQRGLHSCWNQPDVFRNLPPKDERCQHLTTRRTLAPPVSFRSEPAGYCCECGKYLPSQNPQYPVGILPAVKTTA